ncbi:MAG: hypothetical protein K5686_07390 [Lachnospiraceae bacterium]|nr:hypothetical protein [Lachnospiraceae bacterium]
MISIHEVELRADEIERLGRLAANPGPLTNWENSVSRMVETKRLADEKEMEMNGKKGFLGKFFIASVIASVLILFGLITGSDMAMGGVAVWLIFFYIILFLKIRSLYKDKISSIIIRLIIGYFVLALPAALFVGIGRAMEDMGAFGMLIPVIAAVVSGLLIQSNKMKKSGAWNRAKIAFQAAERDEQAAWDELDKTALVLLPEGYRSSQAAAAAYNRLRSGCRTMADALGLQ